MSASGVWKSVGTANVLLFHEKIKRMSEQAD